MFLTTAPTHYSPHMDQILVLIVTNQLDDAKSKYKKADDAAIATIPVKVTARAALGDS